ncbi:MAG: Protein kinase:GAF [Paucimonas sp.]|nr:Protein kinase:GAF [Paucimonas sp.]
MSEEQQSAVERLLEKMNSGPGFAGLGASVQTISSMNDDDDSGSRTITSTILRDAALTSKLLRLANSSARGGRNVSTIDQAIIILGLNTVKSVALSLALLDSLSNKPQSKQLHAEIVAAYFCGTLGHEITRVNAPRYNAQEAQVCGLLQNLGRMMAVYYLYEDIEQARKVQAEKNITEDEAVQEVLGMSFEAIGAAIAQQWNLPDVLQQSLAPQVGKAPPRAAANALGWHQMCALFSKRVTDAVFRGSEAAEKSEITQNINFFRTALMLREDEVQEKIEKALQDTGELLEVISFPCTIDQARGMLRKGSEKVLDLLSAQDSLTKASGDSKRPIEIVQQVLRMIHDDLGFDCTLLCLPSGASLVAVAGVGRNAAQAAAKFRCQGAKPDIFRAVMAKKIDTYVADVNSPAYAKMMPDWYADALGARSFLAMSLVAGDQFLGMVYGDYSEIHPSPPAETVPGRMRQWRNHLVTALQAGAKR